MSIRKGLSLFLIITLATSLAVLAFSVDRTSLKLLFQADKRKLFLACLLVALTWLLDSLKLQTLSLAAGEKVSLKLSLILTWLNYFGCAVTPMQSGGAPLQVYVLMKNGTPIGKGVAITLTRTLLTVFFLGLAVPFAILIEPGVFGRNRLMQAVIFYVLFFIIVSWVLVVLSFIKPKLIKRWGDWFLLFLHKIGLIKRNLLYRVIRRVNKEIDIYNENIRLFFSGGRDYFALAFVISFFHMLVQLAVLPCMIWALGLPVSFMEAILIQAIFLFMLYFIPTPGGSGAAEGGGAAMFGLLVPWNMAGVVSVAWRFLVEYTGVFIGAVVAFRLLGWGTAESLIEKAKKDPENLD